MGEREGRSDGEDTLPLLRDHIERFGFGFSQLRSITVGAGSYFGDGVETMLLSCLAPIVGAHWHLSACQRGLAATCLLFGILVGNFGSGPFGDNCGRKWAITASMSGLFIFCVFNGLSISYGAYCVTALLAGCSFGLGQPSWNALGAEVTPMRWRIVSQSASQSFFTIGEIFACVLLMLEDPMMKELDWRRLVLLGSIPAGAYTLLAVFVLNESPYWLAAKGRFEETKAVLASMRRDNGLPDDGPLDFSAPEVAIKSARSGGSTMSVFQMQLGMVFGRQLFWQTLIVMYSLLVNNLMYYGCMYAFAQMLPGSGHSRNAALELMTGALWEFPGQLMATVPLPRKVMMRLYAILTTTSLILACQGYSLRAPVMLYLGYYGIKCFGFVGCIILYQYPAEIYPTPCRSVGASVNMVAARVGALVSPMFYELTTSLTGGCTTFFFIIACLLGLNVVLFHFLKYETQGRPLKDALTPATPCSEDHLLTPAPLSVR